MTDDLAVGRPLAPVLDAPARQGTAVRARAAGRRVDRRRAGSPGADKHAGRLPPSCALRRSGRASGAPAHRSHGASLPGGGVSRRLGDRGRLPAAALPAGREPGHTCIAGASRRARAAGGPGSTAVDHAQRAPGLPGLCELGTVARPGCRRTDPASVLLPTRSHPDRDLAPSAALLPGEPDYQHPGQSEDRGNLIRGIFRGVGDRRCTIHVFTDALSHPRLRDLADAAGSQSVMVYDPSAEQPTTRANGAKPRRRKGSRRSRGALRWNEWRIIRGMNWIARVGRARDGHLSHRGARRACGGRGDPRHTGRPSGETVAGAAPRVPAPRLVTAPYLAAVLELVGAPAALLGLTDGPISRIAGRALGDDLARRRPSMLAVHDLDRNTTCQEVESIYRFFATREPSRPPFGSNVTVFCHPAQVIDMPDVPAELDVSLQEALRGARDAARQLVRQAGADAGHGSRPRSASWSSPSANTSRNVRSETAPWLSMRVPRRLSRSPLVLSRAPRRSRPPPASRYAHDEYLRMLARSC